VLANDELRETRGMLVEAEQRLLESRAEQDLLLAQFQAAQEEFALLIRAGAGAASAHLGGSAVIEYRRDEPPHRELRFACRDVSLGARILPVLRVKLVEHVGRPGLVLIADPDGAHALSHWHADGVEDDQEYMLLVPADATSKERLLRLGTTDWESLLDLAALLHTVVAAQSDLDERWPTVAARLQAELNALPARLRYDQLELASPASEAQSTQITLSGVRFGSRRMQDITLTWTPGRERNELVWDLPTNARIAPPLSAWPVEAEGTLAPHWPLAVGAGFGFRSRLRWWRTLEHDERTVLLSLLDVLPSAASGLRRQARRASACGQIVAALRARLGQ
jgi:hypothetical protein